MLDHSKPVATPALGDPALLAFASTARICTHVCKHIIIKILNKARDFGGVVVCTKD